MTRAQFERKLSGKLRGPQFDIDVELLLARSCDWDMENAVQEVSMQLIMPLPSAPWEGMK